ncbi:MAG TPA: hypothetical protein VM509_06665, partial [Planctomycetota bacterium]|nr:hypothetical protein [Planctomycetota bacterium]
KGVQWEDLKLSAAPELWWSIRNAAATSDGGLAIFLARSEKQPTLYAVHSGAPRTFPEISSERLLIHVFLDHDDEPWAFERGTDGRYEAVPRKPFEAEVDCRAMPSEGKSWFVGWQWHGLWDVSEQIPAYELGHKVRIRFSVPVEGATLYWSASGNPPRAGNEPGGSMPVDAVSGTLVLQ